MKINSKYLLLIPLALAITCSSKNTIKNADEKYSKIYKVGERGPAGGFIFYDKGSYSNGWRYLEAAPKDLGKAEWGCYNKIIPGTGKTGIGAGKSNTIALLKKCNKIDSAVRLASKYRGGGKSDWYIPSKKELNLLYKVLYKKRLGNFSIDKYWSSSSAKEIGESSIENPGESGNTDNDENSGDPAADLEKILNDKNRVLSAKKAWYQNFHFGYQGKKSKNYSYRIRLIRAF